MTPILFYAWPKAPAYHPHCRWIRAALQDALQRISAEATMTEADRAWAHEPPPLTGDRQTLDSPAWGEAPLKAIDASTLVVCDLSSIGQAETGQALPDPDVLIEYGYALGKLGPARMVVLINSALGYPEAQALRVEENPSVVYYHLREGASVEEQTVAKQKLVDALTPKFQAILANADLPLDTTTLNGYDQGQRALVAPHPQMEWNNTLKQMRRQAKQNIERVSANISTQAGSSVFLYLNKSLLAFEDYVAFALAGVESQQEPFNQQIGMMHDLLDCPWPQAGVVRLVEMPYALACTFQAVYGGVCLATNQVELAVQMAYTTFRQSADPQEERLVRNDSIFGHPKTLGNDPGGMWSFLKDLPETWPWLLDIFDDQSHYIASISAYYLTLDLFELTHSLKVYADASGYEECLVPLCFIEEGNEILHQAISIVRKNLIPIQAICQRQGVEFEQIQQAWHDWTQRAIADHPAFASPEFSHPYRELFALTNY